MKKFLNICILFAALPYLISSIDAETIPLEKGNTWIYSYSKKDSSRSYPYRNSPGGYDSINHYFGTLSLVIDSITNINNPVDTPFFWLAIIDSGVIHRTEWDTSNREFITTIKPFKVSRSLKFYNINEKLISIDSIPYGLLCPLTYNIPRDTFYDITQWYRKIKTDSTSVILGNKKYTVFSTLDDFKHWGHDENNVFQKHQWISHIGTAYWSYDNYYHHSWVPTGQRYLQEFVLQSFNGNSLPVINVIETKNATTLSKATILAPINRIFQKTVIIGDRTSSIIYPMDIHFTIQGQKATNSKCSQLIVQKMLLR